MIGRTIRETRDLLGPLDPSAQESVVPAAERQADLQRVLSTPQTGNRLRTPALLRRKVLWGAAGTVAMASVAAVLAVNVLGHQSPAAPYAVTPVPLSFQKPSSPQAASVALNALATRVAKLEATPRASGYTHIVTDEWNLHTQIGGQQVTSAVVPEHTEMWKAADGSGKTVTSYKPPVFQSAADRSRWVDEGAPGDGTPPHTQQYAAGELSPYWDDAAPAEPRALAQWLQQAHPASNGPAEVLVAISDLAGEQLLSPEQQAGVLKVLATVPGLSYDGAVTDRAGRQGIAFSVDSSYSGLPSRYTLIVNGQTGSLQGYEEMLTRDPGELKVRIPAVTSYKVFVSSDAEQPR